MEEYNDKHGFEEEWAEAFSDAELAPADHVWSKVEASVASNQSDKIKKSLLFFKFLAAASVAFALSVGGAGWYFWANPEQYGQSGQNLANHLGANDTALHSDGNDDGNIAYFDLNKTRKPNFRGGTSSRGTQQANDSGAKVASSTEIDDQANQNGVFVYSNEDDTQNAGIIAKGSNTTTRGALDSESATRHKQEASLIGSDRFANVNDEAQNLEALDSERANRHKQASSLSGNDRFANVSEEASKPGCFQY